MNARQARIVWGKEVRELMRDRRTLISTLVLPVLLIPLLAVGFGFLTARQTSKVRQEAQQTGLKVMVLGAERAPGLVAFLAQSPVLRLAPATPDYAARIASKEVRAAIDIPAGLEAGDAGGGLALPPEAAGLPVVRILHYMGEYRSQMAVRELQRLLREYRDRVVTARLAGMGLTSRDLLAPFAVAEENVAASRKVSGNLLGGIIPYMIVILCFVGAMNPAMDLTAGEKERGTLETLLTSPVDRSSLVVGKFLATLAAALASATLSLASFGATFSILPLALSASGPDARASLLFSISPGGLLAVLAMMGPLAVMFSAVLLAVSLLARSYKEAQSYGGPMMFLVIGLALVGMLPGMELTWRYVFVPVTNVSLISKEILTGRFPWGAIAVVFGTSCLYAGAALAAAAAAFRRESVLFR